MGQQVSNENIPGFSKYKALTDIRELINQHESEIVDNDEYISYLKKELEIMKNNLEKDSNYVISLKEKLPESKKEDKITRDQLNIAMKEVDDVKQYLSDNRRNRAKLEFSLQELKTNIFISNYR